MAEATFAAFLANIWSSAGGETAAQQTVHPVGDGALASVFAVTDLAAASIAAAGLAATGLIARRHGQRPPLLVDRRLASFWFGLSLRPEGWTLPPAWDPIAGDYQAADGWIRLHTNAPHHRAAALAVLGVPVDKDQVARAVAGWTRNELEAAVVAQGGCAAAMHSQQEWAAHPQGSAVAAEPLLHIATTGAAAVPDWRIPRHRPLQGVRVLDLTRVLAGPVATRFLAGLGAEVLRLDPPTWEEPGVVPEVLLGKRAARLDLRAAEGRGTFERLLAGADVLVHGYRPGALAGLGLDEARRQAIRPGLVDVSLDAYGWTGPWAGRRGFDSLVQMSSGIAEAGMRRLGKDRPHPLPVQAVDHACGYIMACAALMGVGQRLETGRGFVARASLARTAVLLASQPAPHEAPLAAATPNDVAPEIEATAWGPAHRIRPPVMIDGTPLRWDHPAGPLGTSPAAWSGD